MGKLFLIGMAIAVATLIGMAVFVSQLRSARGEAGTALWFARIDEFFLRNIECQI
jgi:hypothetical protein